jgi:hypothetical protein
MSTTAPHPATTPIPVQLPEEARGKTDGVKSAECPTNGKEVVTLLVKSELWNFQ